MSLPPLVLHPAFNITRISHVVLTCRDLDASCRFYCDVLGLVLTERDSDVAYLRGLEEACHHSLVLRKSAHAPVCQAIGFRVLTEADLDIAQEYFARRNIQNRWQDAPCQGRTLRLIDGSGSLIELCTTMGTQPRLMQRFDKFHGGSPQRLDHVQVAAADIQAACDFYAALGFRLTEYTAKDGTDELWGVWLQRKGNPHDIVFSKGAVRGFITSRTQCPKCAILFMHVMSRRAWDVPADWSEARAGTASATRCSSISAIQMATGSSCSTPTIKQSIRKILLSAGT